MLKSCHWCQRPMRHNGMFCRAECGRLYWVAQADESPLRSDKSRATQEAMARSKEWKAGKKTA